MIDEDRIRTARRLCFFAHFHPHDIVEAYVTRYVAAIRDAGFTTVVLSTAALPEAEIAKLRAVGAEVILRENKGLDFGGWIEACTRFFPIQADFLMFANDSVYGPLGDLTGFIDRLTREEADFYGAVESLEIEPHLQSWFLLFRPSAYRSQAFKELMCRPMPEMKDKGTLIAQYEVSLTQSLVKAGLRYRAAFAMAHRVGLARRYPYNPAHLLWRDILEAGVPFLKIELLRLNLVRVTDTAGWPDVVRPLAPEMPALIEADLKRRGVSRRPGFLQMSRAMRIYWPEVRGIILRDYRSGKDNEARGRRKYILAYRLTVTLARIPRRIYARLAGG